MTRSVGSASDDWRPSGVRAKTSDVPTIRAVSLMRATKKRSLTTATALIDLQPVSSIILLVVPQPVLVPLREVGQRREVAHPVEIDRAVEVVGLVLDDPGQELLGEAFDPAPLAVKRVEPHRG